MAELVRVAELLQRGPSYDKRRITATGLWRSGFEASWFAGAWLSCSDSWESGDPYAHHDRYVRVTGVWYASPQRGYGHLGVANQTFVAEHIEVLPLVPTVTVGPGELAARQTALAGELVGGTVPVCIGHNLSTIDGIPLPFPLDHNARDPVETMSRVLVWIENGLFLLERVPIAEPRLVDVPEVAVDELRAHTGSIVDVVGELVRGRYWPRLGGLAFVPPEVTTTNLASLEYGSQEPPPDVVVRWQERLADGPLLVRARGRVDGKRFSAFRMKIGGAPWVDLPDWAR